MHKTTSALCRLLMLWLLVGGCTTDEPPAHQPPARQEPPAPQVAKQTQCTEVSVHCGSAPNVRFDGQGRLWAVFAQSDRVYVTASDDSGASYSTAVRVNAEPETIETNGENRPKIAFGDGGEIYVSWTRKLEGRFNGEIRFSRSLDGGRSFEPPRTVNDDGLAIGHRFDSLHVDARGDVYLAWIDKRDREATRARGEEYRGAALYYSTSTDRGASFAVNRRVADHACECCRIGMTERAEDGVAILWRHIFDADVRDHAFATLAAGGVSSSLQRATRDGWHLDGCPHHGPAIVPADEGSYHLTWFTAAEGRPIVYYGRFRPASGEIQTQHVMTANGAGAHPHILEAGGRLLVAWKESDGEQTSVYLRQSIDGGETWSERTSITHTSGGSDHPFLVPRGRESFLSWHTAAEGLRVIPLS